MGALGNICNLTRPLVAFSTAAAQPPSTSRVKGWLGPTQLDMVKVVCAETLPTDSTANTVAVKAILKAGNFMVQLQ